MLVPGGVTLPPAAGEDAGKIQSIGARYAHGEISLEDAAELGCRACASPGGGCQFLGTAATPQVVGEALGMSLPHSALAPSGQPIWLDWPGAARRRAVQLQRSKIKLARHSYRRRGSQRDGRARRLRRIDQPAAAHAGHRPRRRTARPTVDDWHDVNRRVPRFVDALPNGPVGHPTVHVFLAGGVPEVMLHLRELGLLDLDVLTVGGCSLGEVLDWWQSSERRASAARS